MTKAAKTPSAVDIKQFYFNNSKINFQVRNNCIRIRSMYLIFLHIGFLIGHLQIVVYDSYIVECKK